MLQFHKTLHTHKIVVHPRHLPLLRLPSGTCRESERARGEEKEREGERGHQSQIGHSRRKDRKAQKETRKRAGLKKTTDSRLQSVSEEVGGERKWNRRG